MVVILVVNSEFGKIVRTKGSTTTGTHEGMNLKGLCPIPRLTCVRFRAGHGYNFF